MGEKTATTLSSEQVPTRGSQRGKAQDRSRAGRRAARCFYDYDGPSLFPSSLAAALPFADSHHVMSGARWADSYVT